LYIFDRVIYAGRFGLRGRTTGAVAPHEELDSAKFFLSEDKKKTSPGWERVVQGEVNRIVYFLSGQTPFVQPASFPALSVAQAAFSASVFALQVAQAPPAFLQPAQAATLTAFVSAGFSAAHTEQAKTPTVRITINFFMKPPFVA
jgi:hypothetical protein